MEGTVVNVVTVRHCVRTVTLVAPRVTLPARIPDADEDAIARRVERDHIGGVDGTGKRGCRASRDLCRHGRIDRGCAQARPRIGLADRQLEGEACRTGIGGERDESPRSDLDRIQAFHADTLAGGALPLRLHHDAWEVVREWVAGYMTGEVSPDLASLRDDLIRELYT